jgi:hypothetical protein
LIGIIPIISGCIDYTGEEDDPFTEFALLGSNQDIGDYPEYFLIDELQNVFLMINNHENERVDYAIRISISSDASLQRYDDLSDIEVSTNSSAEIRIDMKDGEERIIPCRFSIPEVGIFRMNFKLMRDGEEYRYLKLWVKVFDSEMMKIAPNDMMVYTAGRNGDPATIPETTDIDGYFNFTIGLVPNDQEIIDLNITFRIGLVMNWTIVSRSPGSENTIHAIFENGTGYYLPVRISNNRYFVIPLVFIIESQDVQLMIEVRSSNWSMDFSLPIS